MDVINFMANAWLEVESTTIINCLKRSGFIVYVEFAGEDKIDLKTLVKLLQQSSSRKQTKINVFDAINFMARSRKYNNKKLF